MLAISFLLLCSCANRDSTPSVPWLLGTTLLSAAGMPPARPDFYATPVRVSETLKFTAITTGADHTCAIEVGGETYCWGSNQYQQLGSTVPAETCGNGGLSCSATPVRIEDAPAFTALTASLWGTCGLDASGAAHCWGFGLGGRQGDPLPESSGVPVAVPGNHAFVALAASAAGNSTCGLTSAGQAWCWSVGGTGGSGSGQSPVFAGPDRIATTQTFVAISVSTQHGCGIDEALNVFCWGSNQFGQLGIGSSALDGGIRESLAPVAVHGGHKFDRIVAGPGHSCGLHTGRPVYCWGLGFPGDTDASVLSRPRDRRSIPYGSLPVLLGTAGPEWLTLAAGTTQTCALAVDSGLYCFSTTPVPYGADRRPLRLESDETFVSLAVGGNHACALSDDGSAYCWGLSHLAQVGRPPSGR